MSPSIINRFINYCVSNYQLRSIEYPVALDHTQNDLAKSLIKMPITNGKTISYEKETPA